MSRASAIAAGRRAALKGMTDTWTVYRVGLEWSDATGADVETTTTVYDGPGKLQSFESYEQNPNAGGHEYTVMRPHLHLPLEGTSADVEPKDVAVCTASVADASMVGIEVKVEGRQLKTYMTARRFPVSEVKLDCSPFSVL